MKHFRRVQRTEDEERSLDDPLIGNSLGKQIKLVLDRRGACNVILRNDQESLSKSPACIAGLLHERSITNGCSVRTT